MSEEIKQKEAFQKRFQMREDRFEGDVVERVAVQEIPVIDVGALVDETSTLEARKRVASEIRTACINSGFFYIANYGVSVDEMDEAVDWSRRFFNLPREIKEKYRNADISTGRSYNDSEKITPGYEPDYKEYYDMGLELKDDRFGVDERGAVFWPDEDMPGFKEFFREHIRRMVGIGQKMARGFALSLDLEETFFDQAFDPPYLNFRPSYYPPAQNALKANRWSCGPHTDYMAFTMLYQDDVGGLEVMNLDGDWIPATPIKGTQVFNIADMMSSWTNDLYASTPHRVANRTPDKSRISLASFMGPNSDFLVECLDSCKSETNPARYPPITTHQHVMNIFKESLPEGMIKDVKTDAMAATDMFRDSDRIGS